MRSISQDDAVATLPSLIDGLAGDAVVIEREGKDVAVLITPDEYDSIRQGKIKRLLESSDRLSREIRSNVRNDEELDDLMRALDRKAS